MRGLHSVVNHFRYIKTNNLLVVAFFALGLFAFGALGLTQTSVKAEMIRDCDNNAIMKCGAADTNEFRTKYDQNATGDLPAIYGHYWIPRDLQVVQGQSFKDGTVRVNGRIVADNAKSIGREAIAGSRPISIGGKTYYETANGDAFVTDGLPTMVALDAQGNFKYAVINGCGNPIYARSTTPPPPPPAPEPKYTCDNVSVQNISSTKKRFTVTASASNGAQITGYTFNFGDNTSKESSTASIDHEFTAANTYTVVATVKVKVGSETKYATGPNCTKQVKVELPPNKTTVCDLTTKTTKEIDEDKFDSTKHSKNYADCEEKTISVCVLATKTTETIKEADFDSSKHSKNSADCVEAPALPKTGSADMLLSGLGAGSMIVSASLYLGSRRDFLSTLLGR